MVEIISFLIPAAIIAMLVYGIYRSKKRVSEGSYDLESPEDIVIVKIGLREYAKMRREDADVYNSLNREGKRKVIRKLKEQNAKR